MYEWKRTTRIWVNLRLTHTYSFWQDNERKHCVTIQLNLWNEQKNCRPTMGVCYVQHLALTRGQMWVRRGSFVFCGCRFCCCYCWYSVFAFLTVRHAARIVSVLVDGMVPMKHNGSSRSSNEEKRKKNIQKKDTKECENKWHETWKFNEYVRWCWYGAGGSSRLYLCMHASECRLNRMLLLQLVMGHRIECSRAKWVWRVVAVTGQSA